MKWLFAVVVFLCFNILSILKFYTSSEIRNKSNFLTLHVDFFNLFCETDMVLFVRFISLETVNSRIMS